VTLFFQFCQQRLIAEILLEIDRPGFVHKIDLGYRATALAEMSAVVDKRPVFANVVIVCSDIGSLVGPDTEIDAVAAGLRDNIQSGDRVAAIRQKKYSDLFDYGLRKDLAGKGKKKRVN
jgi:hypothetical protein